MEDISYQPTIAEKPIRDYMLDDKSGLYCRENLERIIAKNNRNRASDEQKQSARNVSYNYYDVDLDKLSAQSQGAPQKDAITTVRKLQEQLHKELMQGGFHIAELEGIVRQQQNVGRVSKKAVSRDDRKKIDYAVSDMQIYLNNYSFLLRHDIFSYQQMKEKINILSDLYAKTEQKYNQLASTIQDLKEKAAISKKAEAIEKRIKMNQYDCDYMMNEYIADIDQLERYQKRLRNFSLKTPQDMKAFEEHIETYSLQLELYKRDLMKIQAELKQYESNYDCLRDAVNGKDTVHVWGEDSSILRYGEKPIHTHGSHSHDER